MASNELSSAHKKGGGDLFKTLQPPLKGFKGPLQDYCRVSPWPDSASDDSENDLERRGKATDTSQPRRTHHQPKARPTLPALRHETLSPPAPASTPAAPHSRATRLLSATCLSAVPLSPVAPLPPDPGSAAVPGIAPPQAAALSSAAAPHSRATRLLSGY